MRQKRDESEGKGLGHSHVQSPEEAHMLRKRVQKDRKNTRQMTEESIFKKNVIRDIKCY